jgi:hypothetical protein
MWSRNGNAWGLDGAEGGGGLTNPSTPQHDGEGGERRPEEGRQGGKGTGASARVRGRRRRVN